jgi:ring-1,2-phenylacetyl-CoA epoxidase subunit PaaB
MCDATMALENARDALHTQNGRISIWVVPISTNNSFNPENNGETFEPAMDKAYRHPTFYELPDELKHM